MRGSPPDMITKTLWGSVRAAMLSSTRRKSSLGISACVACALQSLPQCRQRRLQRRVHSQNNCCRGCSCNMFCSRLRQSSSASFFFKVNGIDFCMVETVNGQGIEVFGVHVIGLRSWAIAGHEHERCGTDAKKGEQSEDDLVIIHNA